MIDIPEKVLVLARIFGDHTPECGAESVPCAPDCACVAAARAAIEALREPTYAIMQAFASAHPDEWRAAIDAALGKPR